MKVLQINTVCGKGSTGRTCTELAQVLIDNGHECHIAYGQGTTTYLNSYKIGTRFENHLHNAFSRLSGKQGYYTKRGTRRLIQYICELQPDVVHLRNLHGNYLNLQILFEFLADADLPVVWTLHDCWAFTGKCTHYTNIGCYKWQSHCAQCSQVRQYPPSLFIDRSEKMFSDKKKWFTSVKNMTIVPVSKWLAGEVQQSFLGEYSIVPIYNWIDQQIFKHTPSTMREYYGFTKDTFVILGVSARWEKKSSKLQDFIKLSQMLPENVQIVLIGEEKEPGCIPDPIVHINYIHGVDELSKFYTLADVYLHLSMEDTFGKVIVEALACGTPAIVYNSTACPEVVGEGCGFVAAKRNIESVYQTLTNIQHVGKKSFSANCITSVAERFNYCKNATAYINLYNEIVVMSRLK